MRGKSQLEIGKGNFQDNIKYNVKQFQFQKNIMIFFLKEKQYHCLLNNLHYHPLSI